MSVKDTPDETHQAVVTERIIEALFNGEQVVDIAKRLGIGRSTVYRHFKKWANSEEATALKCEWLELYNKVKVENPGLALDKLTRLVARTIREQSTVEVSQDSKVVVEIVKRVAPVNEGEA